MRETDDHETLDFDIKIFVLLSEIRPKSISFPERKSDLKFGHNNG